MTTHRTFLLAAGGTGGHVMPALALAHELVARGHIVIFATDNRGLRFVPEEIKSIGLGPRDPGGTGSSGQARGSIHVKTIRAGTLRKHPVRLIKDLFSMTIGVLQSFDLIRDYTPDAIVGFGGYPSFPPVFAAQILRRKTVLHSADAVIGRANLMLAKFCTRLALSFPNFKGINEKLRARTVVTGLPVRAAIDDLRDCPYIPPEPTGPFHITIMGGSQGAGVLGIKLATILAALPPSERARLHLTHQVRAEDLETVQALYRNANITATCASFIQNIPEILSTTHLFIGRSGASTVMEMGITGRPAIYIPLIASTHHDAQQRENANVFVHLSAAEIIEESDFTQDHFLAKLTALMHDPARLSHMSQAARGGARPFAARALADMVESLI
jgi:UDP-N-acetylglucosamine--N-acetylmuramyl-(pentapeptide) pyrophosphoryl-undecaprenol N-acetylglucosamine transferase